jgi:hypothetical protein
MMLPIHPNKAKWNETLCPGTTTCQWRMSSVPRPYCRNDCFMTCLSLCPHVVNLHSLSYRQRGEFSAETISHTILQENVLLHPLGSRFSTQRDLFIGPILHLLFSLPFLPSFLSIMRSVAKRAKVFKPSRGMVGMFGRSWSKYMAYLFHVSESICGVGGWNTIYFCHLLFHNWIHNKYNVFYLKSLHISWSPPKTHENESFYIADHHNDKNEMKRNMSMKKAQDSLINWTLTLIGTVSSMCGDVEPYVFSVSS